MKDKTKNIISVILPIVSIFVIALGLRMEPTGLAVYKEDIVYSINGSISINLQGKIPANSHIIIEIDNEITKINLPQFLEMSDKDYKITQENNKDFISGEGIYQVSLNSLGINQTFKEGIHFIETKVIYEDSVLYQDKQIIDI